MNKRPIIAVAIIISALITGGVILAAARSNHATQPQQSDMRSDQTKQTANQVYITDYTFSPEVIKVKKGTTVVWVNQDIAAHTVESSNDQNAGQFKASSLLEKGQRHSVTFDTAGTFNYFCGPHPYMKGSVEVSES